MGKNPKNAERTKNNTRPSSSGRSAELLQNCSQTNVVFASQQNTFATVAGNPDSNPDVTPEFRVVLKKLKKKDVTTRQKALIEFSELCKSSNKEDVIALLPYWPRIYNTFSNDPDYSIRDAVQIAHGTFAKVTNLRETAEFAKIVSQWFISCYDTRKSENFNIAEKIVIFQTHRKTILQHIVENLNKKPEAYEGDKHDFASLHERRLVMNLLAYAALLSSLPRQMLSETILFSTEYYTGNYWKLLKTDSNYVKTAWFNMLLAIMKTIPYIVYENGKKTCLSLFTHLDYENNDVITKVWQCLPYCWETIPDWINHVSLEKLLLPKLFNVLKCGGYGSSFIIYRRMTAFVSYLEKHAEDRYAFIAEVMDHWTTGMMLAIPKDQMHYSEIISSFFRYVRLLVMRHFLDQKQCINVIGKKLMEVIGKTIENSSSMTFTVTVFRNFSLLLRGWNKHRYIGKTRIFESLLKFVWESLYDILQNVHKSEDAQLIQVLTNHLLVLELLYDPLSHNDLIQKEIPKDDYQEDKLPDNITAANPSSLEESFGSDLMKSIVKLLGDYFTLVMGDKEKDLFINHLCTVLFLFDEKEYFRRLDSLLKQAYKKRNDELVMKEWANMKGVHILGVVRLYCNLAMHMNRDTTAFLNDIAEQHRGEMLLICLDLSTEGRVGTAIKNWSEDTSYLNSLLQYTKEICSFDSPEEQKPKVEILKQCIEKFDLIDKGTARQYMVSMLKTIRLNLFDMLKYGEEYEENEMPIVTIRNAAEVIYLLVKHADKQMLSGLYGPLISDIVSECFGVTCDVNAKIDEDDIIYKVWRYALENMSRVEGCDIHTMYDGVMYFCAMQLATRMATSCMCENEIDNMLDHVRTLIDTAPIKRIALEQCHSDDIPRILGGDSDEIDSILSDDEFLTEDEPYSRFSEIAAMTVETFLRAIRQTFRLLIHPGLGDAALKGEYFTGSITYNDALHKQHVKNLEKLWKRFPPGDKMKAPEEFNMIPNFQYIHRYCSGLYFQMELLYHYVCVDNLSLANLKNMNKRSKPFISTLCIAKNKKSINFMIYQFTTICSLHRHYEEMKQFDNIHPFSLKNVRCKLQFLVKYHNQIAFDQMKELVIKNAINNGMLWACTLSCLIYELTDRITSMDVFEVINDVNYDFQTDRGIHCYELLTARDGFDWSKLIPDEQVNHEKLVITSHNIVFHLKYFSGIPDAMLTTANQWIDLLAKQECKMCFDEDLLLMNLHDIVQACSIIRFMESVTNKMLHLQNEENEFLMIVCISWIRSIKRTCIVEGRDIVTFMYSENSTAICMFIYEALKYFMIFENFAESKGMDNGYTRTWIELFKNEAHSFILDLWKTFLEMDSVDTVEEYLMIKTVSLTVRSHVDCWSLIENDLNWWIVFLSGTAIRSHHLEASLTAYTMLAEIFGDRMKSADVFNKVKWESLCLESYEELFRTIIPFERVGAIREVNKNSPDFSIVRGYFLLWTVILKAYMVNNTSYREQMVSYFREGKYVGRFLRSLTSFMPHEVFCNPTDVLAKRIQELFLNDFDPLTTRNWSDRTIVAWSCHLYYMTLKTMPLFSRQWFCELEGKDMAYVERLTIQFASPSLIMEELKEVSKCPQSDVFKTRGYPATREILTSYKIDDITMSEKVTVSANYPLGLCTTDEAFTQKNKTYPSLGVTINLFLSKQNANIRDGVLIWKKNLERKFAGIDECYICFSVSYGTTLKLPTMSCKQCQKKFHPDCLYRWIHSSTNPACPLCRTLF